MFICWIIYLGLSDMPVYFVPSKSAVISHVQRFGQCQDVLIPDVYQGTLLTKQKLCKCNPSIPHIVEIWRSKHYRNDNKFFQITVGSGVCRILIRLMGDWWELPSRGKTTALPPRALVLLTFFHPSCKKYRTQMWQDAFNTDFILYL